MENNNTTFTNKLKNVFNTLIFNKNKQNNDLNKDKVRITN